MAGFLKLRMKESRGGISGHCTVSLCIVYHLHWFVSIDCATEFNLVHWGAILESVGAMFALTFFSLLHVPINVPALAQSTGEDNADLNHELKLHGYSNFLSGCAGSIQNYLVYANTLFFMRSGGNSRLAGFMLAALTAVTLVMGPKMIGFIPVMMVGTLIFVLGFELISDALVAPRRKLQLLEYLTVSRTSVDNYRHD